MIRKKEKQTPLKHLNLLTSWIPLQGWGVAVLVGVPNKDDAFKTHPMNILNERTLKGTFFVNYKPRSDIPSVVEKYMNKVTSIPGNQSLARRIMVSISADREQSVYEISQNIY